MFLKVQYLLRQEKAVKVIYLGLIGMYQPLVYNEVLQ